MIYKSFAVVTLIAAPLVVLAVQSFVPQADHPLVPAAIAPATAAPVAPPVAAAPSPPQPAPMISQPSNEAASFGQPLPDAGKPFLTPGAGLPAAAPARKPEPAAAPALPLNREAR